MLRCSAAFSANGHDSVFHTQKSPQRGGQASGQFLPGQHLAPGAKSCGSYAAQNAVPVLKQIRPARVKQRAEIEIEHMNRENIAYGLARNVFLPNPWQV